MEVVGDQLRLVLRAAKVTAHIGYHLLRVARPATAIGNANTWTTIASGASPIVNGLLANWDTGALPVCAYALRLIVADQALLDCNGAIRHRSEYVTLIEVGNTVCDINGDAVINAFDIEPFLNCLFP